jgi:hypothetical protein
MRIVRSGRKNLSYLSKPSARSSTSSQPFATPARVLDAVTVGTMPRP